MNYEIDYDGYLKVTPAGVYYCMASSQQDLARDFISGRLQKDKLEQLSQENIAQWFGADRQKGLDTLNHLQKINWIVSSPDQICCSKDKLEDVLPKILPDLSSQQKVLLADAHGFYISSAGFPHETAEEISALSADIISLHERHQGVLNGNLKLTSSNWGLIDAAGHSQLGFWPLHVGKEVFSLVISGQALFHHPSFFQLAWVLHTRYAREIG